MGFTMYLCRRRVPPRAVVKKGDGAGAQSGSISCKLKTKRPGVSRG
jgi:hypothetical protein